MYSTSNSCNSARICQFSILDILISKYSYNCFNVGGNVSDRQWQDIIGIIKVQGDLLDISYLRYWTAELELSDLLEQARGEAGL